MQNFWFQVLVYTFMFFPCPHISSSAKAYWITASFKISRIPFFLSLTLLSIILKPLSHVLLFMHNCLKFQFYLKQKLGDDNPSGDKFDSRWQLQLNEVPTQSQSREKSSLTKTYQHKNGALT